MSLTGHFTWISVVFLCRCSSINTLFIMYIIDTLIYTSRKNKFKNINSEFEYSKSTEFH